MRITERQYLVALYAFVPFGPTRIKLLKDYFGSAKSVWNAPEQKLSSVGLYPKVVRDFMIHKKDFDFNQYFAGLKKLNINYYTIDDPNYPENLIEIPNAPVILYYLGEIKPSDSNAVAIVGSRKMTSYGREVTERFSRELSNLGITIISGMAFGVDVAAHRSCLEASGRGIVVLASGLDTISPITNRWVAMQILKKKAGAIVSEYPLGFPPRPANFANRNRIISGLSKAVLVVEGRRKSGTLLTASAAADQGRQVFAVPGQITSPMSEAPFFLIENGAKMATRPKDMIDELDLQLTVDKAAVNKVMPADETEEILLKILEKEALHLDEVVRTSKLDASLAAAKLTMMELKGLVRNIGGGVYKRE